MWTDEIISMAKKNDTKGLLKYFYCVNYWDNGAIRLLGGLESTPITQKEFAEKFKFSRVTEKTAWYEFYHKEINITLHLDIPHNKARDIIEPSLYKLFKNKS